MPKLTLPGLLARCTVACIVPSLLTAAACHSTDEARGGGTSTITILYPADERVLGPSWDDSPKFLVFLPLVNFENPRQCGEPTGALAERWEHSSDYRVWTVWLRHGVRWHDGVPVTADDIEFTIDLLKHPDVLSYNAGPVDSVQVLDERSVQFFLSKPDRWPLEGWATFYPKHLLEVLDPKAFYEWEFWTRPVGNGPYRYERHVPQTMMELEANPDYYRGKPRIDRLVLRFTAAGSGSGLLEMRSGNADLISILTPLQASELAEDPSFRAYYRVSTSHTRWLAYNPGHHFLGNRLVRRALTQAIDRSVVHQVLGYREDVPLTDAPYTSCQFSRGELTEPWPYDPAASARSLEEADWRDEDGDGVRERDGMDARFTTIVAGSEERAALVVQDQLRRLGVRMEVQTLDGTLVRDRLRDGEFEAGIPPIVRIEELLAPSPFLPLYADTTLVEAYPRIVQLIDTSRGEPDFGERERLYRELAPEFREALPATYLYPMVYPIVAKRRIRGFNHDGWIPPAWRWPFGGVEFLWIDDGRRP
ncbi:MAG: ABC transporter substrate-binding protein [Gemmatimonadota bacterium]